MHTLDNSKYQRKLLEMIIFFFSESDSGSESSNASSTIVRKTEKNSVAKPKIKVMCLLISSLENNPSKCTDCTNILFLKRSILQAPLQALDKHFEFNLAD